MDLFNVKTKLERNGYEVSIFDTKEQSITYLLDKVKGKTVGFGGSQTITELNLKNLLVANNTVYVPDFPIDGETFASTAKKAMQADVFLLSANAVSENGEIINIDGIGNRLAGSLYGHEKVYYIIGENKIGGTLEEAISRARNIASPKNALRFRHKTPCAMIVLDQLEQKFREKFSIDGEIDQIEWEKFIEGLSTEELNTHCYDCKSAERICCSLLIHFTKPHSMPMEIIIIRKEMGF